MKRTVADIDHLSKSSVELFRACPHLWKSKYLDGKRDPVTPALLIGSAFDATLEAALRFQVQANEPITQASLFNLWHRAWRGMVSEDHQTQRRTDPSTGELTESPINWQGEMPESVENTGAHLVAFEGTLQLVNNLRIKCDASGPWLQRLVTLRTPGVEVASIGYLDLVEDDGVPGDFKTAGRAWTPDKPAGELQPKLYIASLLQEKYPVPQGPHGGYLFRHYVWVKGRSVRIQRFETEYSTLQIMKGVLEFRATWAAIKRGEFAPNRWGSWRCSPKWCAQFEACMESQVKV